MQPWNYLFVLTILVLSGCSSSKPPEPPPTISLSITEFVGRAGVQPGEAETVADALGSLLSQTGRFTLIDRSQVSRLMQEKAFQETQGNQTSGDAHLLVVKKFLTGSLSKLGDNYVFSVKMTDVQSSKIELSLSRTYDDDLEDIVDDFLPEIVREIMTAIDGPPSR